MLSEIVVFAMILVRSHLLDGAALKVMEIFQLLAEIDLCAQEAGYGFTIRSPDYVTEPLYMYAAGIGVVTQAKFEGTLDRVVRSLHQALVRIRSGDVLLHFKAGVCMLDKVSVTCQMHRYFVYASSYSGDYQFRSVARHASGYCSPIGFDEDLLQVYQTYINYAAAVPDSGFCWRRAVSALTAPDDLVGSNPTCGELRRVYLMDNFARAVNVSGSMWHLEKSLGDTEAPVKFVGQLCDSDVLGLGSSKEGTSAAKWCKLQTVYRFLHQELLASCLSSDRTQLRLAMTTVATIANSCATGRIGCRHEDFGTMPSNIAGATRLVQCAMDYIARQVGHSQIFANVVSTDLVEVSGETFRSRDRVNTRYSVDVRVVRCCEPRLSSVEICNYLSQLGETTDCYVVDETENLYKLWEHYDFARESLYAIKMPDNEGWEDVSVWDCQLSGHHCPSGHRQGIQPPGLRYSILCGGMVDGLGMWPRLSALRVALKDQGVVGCSWFDSDQGWYLVLEPVTPDVPLADIPDGSLIG